MSDTTAATTTQAPLAAREIGTGLWLLAPRGDLAGDAVSALRADCVSVLDRGGLDIVIDLRGVRTMCLDALDILALVSETLLARGGRLSLVHDDGGRSSVLVRVDERGLEAVEGIKVLDGARRVGRAVPETLVA